jgi:hypothetical protein
VNLPLTIYHFNKPERAAAEQIAAAASDNLALPKREKALFLYYLSCSNGFAPTQKVIGRECGIPENKIWEVRKKLSDKKLISVSANYIKIDWFRIRAFAMMEKQKRPEAAHAQYGNKNPYENETIGYLMDKAPPDQNYIKWTERRAENVLSNKDPFIRGLRRMTIKEFYDWLSFPFPLPRAGGVFISSAEDASGTAA